MIVPPAYAPPLIVVGVTLTSFSDDGMSVNWPVAEAPLRVAVRVTGVGAVTCPALIWNWVQAAWPCIAIVAGTGAADWFELARPIVAPAAGTPTLNCTSTHVSSPL